MQYRSRPHGRRTRRPRAGILALALTPLVSEGALAQTDQGLWERPFDHGDCPDEWAWEAPLWDHDPVATREDPCRFMAGHMALIPRGPHRGKVLVWNWMRIHLGAPFNLQHWAIVDPAATPPTFLNFDLPLPLLEGDPFCAGHAWTKDGHLLVAGGNRYEPTPDPHDDTVQLNANRLCWRFDPEAPTGNAMWKQERSMFYERWYPSVTTQATDVGGVDHLLVTGGLDATGNALNTYESFDPTNPPTTGTWQPNPNNPGSAPWFAGPVVACPDQFSIYPRHHVLTSGKTFTAGMTQLGSRVDHSNIGLGMPPVWELQASTYYGWRWYASTVLYPNLGGPGGGFEDVVVRIGGSLQLFDQNCDDLTGMLPTETTEYCLAGLPASDPNWKWFQGPSMANARTNQDAVLLPDASVLVVGGDAPGGGPVIQAEVLNDVPHAFRTLASAATNRGYHSTAVLLPSGKVLTAGGENRLHDYEVFRPHYLTNGTVRPVIRNPPQTLAMQYGKTYSLGYQPLPDGVRIAKVVLMAPGSVTHHGDFHQRYVELAAPSFHIAQIGGNPRVTFTAPATSKHAPRGYYMLFLVTNAQGTANKGTPSEATWVHLQ